MRLPDGNRIARVDENGNFASTQLAFRNPDGSNPHFNPGGREPHALGGQQPGQGGASNFNEQAYLDANPDVAAAVQQGQFASGQDHFTQFGMAEKRQPGRAPNLSGAMDATAALTGHSAQPAQMDRGAIQDVQAGRFTDADIGSYMNPFTEQVTETTLNEMQRQEAISRNQMMNQFAGAGAHGGSQQALAQTESLRNFADMVGLNTARLQNQNFQQAQAQISRDQDRSLQAGLANQGMDFGVQQANQQAQQQMNTFNPQFQLNAAQTLAGMAGQGQQMDHADIGMMQGIGDRVRDDEQQHLDLALDDFRRQFDFPFEMLNFRTGLATGQPHGNTTTGPGQNTFAQNIGAFGALAGGLGTAFSDRRLKADIKRVGALPSGLAVYAYRYLWERGQRLGVMADEAAKLFPNAVTTLDGGLLVVDYSKVE